VDFLGVSSDPLRRLRTGYVVGGDMSVGKENWRWIMSMTKTKVTRILRIVFLFWLVVSIALVLTQFPHAEHSANPSRTITTRHLPGASTPGSGYRNP